MRISSNHIASGESLPGRQILPARIDSCCYIYPCAACGKVFRNRSFEMVGQCLIVLCQRRLLQARVRDSTSISMAS